ncbi:hypothetical protein EYC84_001856 [Monilinia fructicola]|uniref:Uncharacterized protein n=1 Tax=Monilinia fructicola TaxID=38448 RepID=A0A5M9JT92_MONFR|nr:hypothetical protein EYC84_001856 [Monilinia fructicola]
MSNSGEKGKFLVIVAVTVIFFWTTMISLMIYFINGEEPPRPIPTCPGGVIHEEKCYCPAAIVHCHPLSSTTDITLAGPITQPPEPASSAKNAIVCFALIISILGILMQIVALNGWWTPWGERVVWKKGGSRWGLTVRPAESDVMKITADDEKTPLLANSK